MARSTFLLIAGLVVGSGISSVTAGEEIRFKTDELDAAQVLVKPDDSTIFFHGRKGEFRPGPTLRFFGVPTEEFDVDLGLGGQLADMRFNALVARGIRIHFEKDRFRAEVPFVDREKGIRSAIGAVHFKGARAVIRIRPIERANGTLELVQEGCEFEGGLRGTGLLASGAILRQVKNAAANAVERKITRLLSKPEVSGALERALVKYAQFSRDGKLDRYVPGTLRVTAHGLVYEAE
jgi:hypothetical protein